MNKKSLKQVLKGLVGFAGVGLLLVGCAGPGGGSYGDVAPAPAPAMSAPVMRMQTDAEARGVVNTYSIPKQRPGLGTGWGDEKDSAITYTNFRRGDFKGVSMIYYNDAAGVDAMKSGWARRGDGMQKGAGGLVEWGVKSGWGYAKNVMGGGKRFVVGTKGREYSLEIRNICRARLEVVLSVDGLDVMDGKGASVKKRGYIIDPGKILIVKGFRTSEEAVAAFKFSTVSGSYANQKGGSTRNVGVIGMGVYVEKGIDPWTWSSGEVKRREGARAFAEAPSVRAR